MSYAYARLDVNARRAEKKASRDADIARRQAGSNLGSRAAAGKWVL